MPELWDIPQGMDNAEVTARSSEATCLSITPLINGVLDVRYALRKEVAVEDFDDGSLLFLCDQLRLVELNPVARDVVAHLNDGRTIYQVAEAVASVYDQPIRVVLADVHQLVTALENQGALESIHTNGRPAVGRFREIKSAADVQHLIIHAAAVTTPEGALLLLGRSGVGKTTTCQALAGCYPTLAGDVTCLVRSGETWSVMDASPWLLQQPEADVIAQDGAPLHAVSRLFKAQRARSKPLSSREACRYLTDALFEVGWHAGADAARKRAWFATVADIARRYPGAALHLTLDAAETCRTAQDWLACGRGAGSVEPHVVLLQEGTKA